MLRHPAIHLLLTHHNSIAVRNVLLSPCTEILPLCDLLKERDRNLIWLFKRPSIHYIYHQFNIHHFYVLHKHWIYVFCVDLRTNSDYLLIQHHITDFYNRGFILYSPVVTICTVSLTFINSKFCPQTLFLCFVWIWEQTAVISLYTIKLLVFITEILLFTAQWSIYVPPFIKYQFYVLSTQCIYVFCVDLK